MNDAHRDPSNERRQDLMREHGVLERIEAALGIGELARFTAP